MTNEDVTTLFSLPLIHPVSLAVCIGIGLVTACIIDPGCNDRAVKLLKAFRRIIKALRG